MNLALKNVIPVPLQGMTFHEESIWGRNVFFEKGNNYLLQAPSGTGKSTLVNLLYGIRHDYNGTMEMDGTDYTAFSLKKWSELRQKNLSVVFQDLCLFPELTVLENIVLKQQLTGAVSIDELKEWLVELGIGEKINTACKFLSLGQQQRVALIRSLAQSFNWLLLDEPFSHLDKKNIEIASGLVKNCCERNHAGLIITSLGENDFFSYHQTLTI